MKKIVISLIIITVVGIVMYVGVVFVNRPVIYKTLSARAQQYINEQKGKNGDRWGMVVQHEEDVKPVKTQSGSTITNACFSFELAFPLLNKKELEECKEYITFESPRGYIVVYQETAPTSNLNENPSITMRRGEAAKYPETNIDINGRRFIIYLYKDEGTGEIAFSQVGDKLFVLNLLGYVDEDLNPEFIKMLKSVKFKE